MMRLNPYFISGFLINLAVVPMVFSISIQGISFIYLGIVLFLFCYQKNTEKIRYDIKIIMIMCLFVVAYIIPSISLNVYDFTVYKAFFFLVKCLGMFLIGMLVSSYSRSFMSGYILSLLLLFALYFLFSVKFFFLGESVSVNNRVEIGDSNPIWVSRYTLEFLICILSIYGINTFKSFVTFSMSLFIVFLSGSKGPVLALFSSYLIKANWKAKVGVCLSIVAIGTLGYYLLIYYSSEDLVVFIEQRFFRLVPDGASAHFVRESRDIVWFTAIDKVFLNLNTLFFGYGVGESYQLLDIPSARYYPHNLLIELLFENGLICMIIFIFLFLFALIKSNLFTALLIFHFVNALFSGDIILNEKVFLFIGLSLFVPRDYKIFVNGRNCKF